ncbi:Short C-terminal domain-containing protein [Fodinibius roseus]|uniref:Short C-terminal domain-containing protein n=1 Tax=Fodinibius roseus TaxID=1194090 RepID=A0A1M5KIV2_9BACT|nr:superinfection immunity protein [Fodinibius roseus]SHG52776.1 Short C-terminal domain-containing protein [Fodinibius roseus]
MESSSLMVWVLFGAYFLPSLVAMLRRHDNTGSIFVLNLLLGWTILGWVIGLVWSFSSQKERVQTVQQSTPDPITDQLERLANLKEREVITDKEFTQQKEKILNQ